MDEEDLEKITFKSDKDSEDEKQEEIEREKEVEE
jgi:hypothetical protein